jgi:hypothetical protein
LHSNAGARLRDEINLLPLSLQPLNLHHHEGHELREPVDVNPSNATNPAAESSLQISDQNFTSEDDDSRCFSGNGGRSHADSLDSGAAFVPVSGSQPAGDVVLQIPSSTYRGENITPEALE